MKNDFGGAFVTWRGDDELAVTLRDAARGVGLAPDYALPLAVGLIDRLRSRVRVLEGTLDGRFLAEAAE